MKKQVLFFLLMLMPMMASAQTEINGIYYNLNSTDKVAEVISVPNGISYEYTGIITIPETVTYGGVKYSVTTIGHGAFFVCGITSVTIPSSVTSIGDYAFCGSGLTTITIPNSVTSIGEQAFWGCSNLTTITIPNSVTSIGKQAFEECSGLTSLTLLGNPNNIGDNVFSGCSNINKAVVDSEIYLSFIMGMKSLKEVILTDNVTSIGEHAFEECSNLTSITIPNSVTSIGGSAFINCNNLTYVNIPNSVKSIGSWAFSGCVNLPVVNNCRYADTYLVEVVNKKVSTCIIKDGTRFIGDSSFENYSDLTSITIPNSVTSIGMFAFSGCYNLTEVKCLVENVPSTSSWTFDECPLFNCTLYVPKNSLNSYKSTSPWSEFGNIVSLSDTPVYTLTYTIDGQIYKSYEYEEGENVVPEPAPTKEGYYFSGWSEIPETMPAHDVTVTGSFIQPSKCEKPVITFLANGKIKVESATEGATCVTNITASNAEPLNDGEISLNTPLIVYTVTSYATKEGYDDSEVATATFRYEKAEGDMNGDGMLNITDVIYLVNMILSK